MAHGIKKSENFAYNLQTGLPWHGLGTPVTGDMAWGEAIKLVEGDYGVEVNETFFSKEANPFYTSNITDFTKYGKDGATILPTASLSDNHQKAADGKKWAIWPAGYMTGTFATVHGRDKIYLGGTVGDRYHAIENDKGRYFVEAFCDISKGTVNTIGVLGDGEDFFACIKLPQPLNMGKNDVVEMYLILHFNHNGKSATKLYASPTRVVCYNTLRMSLANAQNTVSIRHTINSKEKIEAAAETMAKVNEYVKAFAEAGGKMQTVKISDEQFFKTLGLTFMKPEQLAELAGQAVTFERLTSAAGKKTANVMEMILNYSVDGPGQNLAGGTAWNRYNAITGYFTNIRQYNGAKRWYNNYGGTDDGKQQTASRLLLEPALIENEWQEIMSQSKQLLATN